MGNSSWINEQLNDIGKKSVDIEIAMQFASRSKNNLSDASEERASFSVRHLNEFSIDNSVSVRLYVKRDAEEYIESLKIQKNDVEQRKAILIGMGGSFAFDRTSYLIQKYSTFQGLIWKIDLEVTAISKVKSQLPAGEYGSSLADFRRKHENEFSIDNSIKPKISTVKDADEYLQSLKMQKEDYLLKLKIIADFGVVSDYISGDSAAGATKADLQAHTTQTTTAHGGITPSSHVGSGGDQHALAIPNGQAGFISGEDLNKLKTSVAIDTSTFVLKTDVGSGPNQVLRLDANGLVPSANMGTSAIPPYGTTAGTICQGNDPRLSDARVPLAHAVNAATYGYGDTTNAGHLRVGTGLVVSSGTVSVSFGTTSGTVCSGDDPRLLTNETLSALSTEVTDARTSSTYNTFTDLKSRLNNTDTKLSSVETEITNARGSYANLNERLTSLNSDALKNEIIAARTSSSLGSFDSIGSRIQNIEDSSTNAVSAINSTINAAKTSGTFGAFSDLNTRLNYADNYFSTGVQGINSTLNDLKSSVLYGVFDTPDARVENIETLFDATKTEVVQARGTYASLGERLNAIDGGNSMNQATLTVADGGYALDAVVTIPNSLTYGVGAGNLLVFQGPLLLIKGSDYLEASSTTIQAKVEIPAGAILTFIIFHLG